MAEQPTIFTGKQVAEFNTSADTLRQIATMEWNIDTMFANIYAGGLTHSDNIAIDTLFHYLVYVYADRLWALSWKVLQERNEKNKDNKSIATFRDFEERLLAMYEDWKKYHKNEIPTALIGELRIYKRWLYEVKQKQIKLGIPTRTETTSLERLDKAMGV
jgi:hypothetical protein